MLRIGTGNYCINLFWNIIYCRYDFRRSISTNWFLAEVFFNSFPSFFMAGVNVGLGFQHPFASQSDLETMSASKTLENQVLAGYVSSTLSTQKPTIQLDIPAISPLSHVRMSNSATTVTITRRHPALSDESRPYPDYSPYSSSPTTAVNSRAPSPTKDIDAEYEYNLSRQDRLKWRLASGFFAIFLGGWADGGKWISNGLMTCALTRRFTVTGTVIPCTCWIAEVLHDIYLSSQIYRKTSAWHPPCRLPFSREVLSGVYY